MNKVVTFVLVLFSSLCKAATGNASDGQLFVVVIISLMVLLLGIGYFIDFMINKIKGFMSKRVMRNTTVEHDEGFLNSFI
jgi:hypothetical protein